MSHEQAFNHRHADKPHPLYGFTRRGWVALAVLAAVATLWWFQWDPIFPLQRLINDTLWPDADLWFTILVLTPLKSELDGPVSILLLPTVVLGLGLLPRRISWQWWSVVIMLCVLGQLIQGLARWGSPFGWSGLWHFAAVDALQIALVGGVLRVVLRSWTPLLVMAAFHVIRFLDTYTLLNFGYAVTPIARWRGYVGDPFSLSGWMISYHASMIAAVVSIALWQRRQRSSGVPCRSCGYDLTGLINPICPECGKPTTTPFQS